MSSPHCLEFGEAAEATAKICGGIAFARRLPANL
jgi:hypothetical protein